MIDDSPRRSPPLSNPLTVALLLVGFLLLDPLLGQLFTRPWQALFPLWDAQAFASFVMIVARLILLTVIAVIAWRSAIKPANLGLNRAPLGALFPAALAVLGLFLVAQIAASLLPQGSERVITALSQEQAALRSSPLVQLSRIFILLALVPFTEELLFRGILQPLSIAQLGLGAGLLVQAGLFAAMHVQIWGLAAPAMLAALLVLLLLGLFAGVLTRYYHSIWPAVALHTGYNSAVFLMTVVAPRLI